MKRGYLLLLGATGVLLTAAAWADSQLSYVRTKVDGQEYPQPPMEIANGMIRFASDLPSGQWMLFDSSKNMMIMVDETNGTYTPMGKEAFERINRILTKEANHEHEKPAVCSSCVDGARLWRRRR